MDAEFRRKQDEIVKALGSITTEIKVIRSEFDGFRSTAAQKEVENNEKHQQNRSAIHGMRNALQDHAMAVDSKLDKLREAVMAGVKESTKEVIGVTRELRDKIDLVEKVQQEHKMRFETSAIIKGTLASSFVAVVTGVAIELIKAHLAK